MAIFIISLNINSLLIKDYLFDCKLALNAFTISLNNNILKNLKGLIMQTTVNQSILPLTAKINDKNHLEIGGCDTVELVKKYASPLYVYDEEGIRTCCRQYKEAFSSYADVSVLYASKAFMTRAVCKIMKDEGLGLDVVSGGEIYTAINSGFPMQKCYFNGNNKTIDELKLALYCGMGRITVDNFYELELLNEIAKNHEKKVDILLRITPGIECHTHEYIKTGHIDSKFGFDLAQLDEAVLKIKNNYENLELKGLHAHIGSQIFEKDVYVDLIKIIFEQFVKIREKFEIALAEMNIGGGIGVKHTEDEDPLSVYDMGAIITDAFKENLNKNNLNGIKLIIEPGRSIICNSGVTLYTAGSYKQVTDGRKYIAVDGGMADNPRPSMYQAKYTAIVANKANSNPEEVVTIAGRYCESGDILIKDINLPNINPGDIICIPATGAYNYSMASQYNRVGKPAAIIVHKGQSDVIIKRESYQDLISYDLIPERLAKSGCSCNNH
ncbi:MAG TPA: diaminopimelate decarboxylase [Candidatus Gastranaerophilales bacterium]|nr:diaminopimelate decarboxylase [Candidatus Gastranaerophilales bacterium]